MTKKPTKKSMIIDAAWALFMEKGYDDTTVEDIVASSGTSKGTFYHYFTGKDSLLSSLSEIFDSYYETLYPQLDPEASSIEKLITLSVKAHEMIGEKIPTSILISLYSSQISAKGDRHLLDYNRYYYSMIREIAENGLRKGELRQDLRVPDIVHYFSMCERSLVYDYCICNASYDLGEYTQRLLPLMLEGLRMK